MKSIEYVKHRTGKVDVLVKGLDESALLALVSTLRVSAKERVNVKRKAYDEARAKVFRGFLRIPRVLWYVTRDIFKWAMIRKG